jgi:hypothetical protein
MIPIFNFLKGVLHKFFFFFEIFFFGILFIKKAILLIDEVRTEITILTVVYVSGK